MPGSRRTSTIINGAGSANGGVKEDGSFGLDGLKIGEETGEEKDFGAESAQSEFPCF